MTTNSIAAQRSAPPYHALWQRAWRFNRTLTLAILLHVALVPLLLLGMAVDPKVIGGANGWIKPLKFLLSTLIYGVTFLWLLSFVRGRRRWVQVLANVTAMAWSFPVTLVLMLALKATIGVRVDEETEVGGLDLPEHAETAYRETYA